jgi:type VI protein secretion system component VasF
MNTTERTPRRRNDRGEGVISTAIAVLIIAFLGVAMWLGFSRIFDSATKNTQNQVEQIGR